MTVGEIRCNFRPSAGVRLPTGSTRNLAGHRSLKNTSMHGTHDLDLGEYCGDACVS